MTANIEFRLSGGPANTNPNNSIGGQMSTTIVTTEVLNNLFDTITKSQNLHQIEDYRCIYIYNNGDDDFINAKIYIDNLITEGEGSSMTEIKLGIATVNSVPSILLNENTTPSGIVFTSNFSFSKKILPEIPSNSFLPLWIKRKAKNTPLGIVAQESFDLILTGAQ